MKAGGALVTALNKVATYANAVDGNPAPGLGGARLMPARALPGGAANVAAGQRMLSPLQVGLLAPRGGGGEGRAFRVDANAQDVLREGLRALADSGGGGAAVQAALARQPDAAMTPQAGARPPAAALPALQLVDPREQLLRRIERRDATIHKLKELLGKEKAAHEIRIQGFRELWASEREAHETTRASVVPAVALAVARERDAAQVQRWALKDRFRAELTALRAELIALRAELDASRAELANGSPPLKRGRT